MADSDGRVRPSHRAAAAAAAWQEKVTGVREIKYRSRDTTPQLGGRKLKRLREFSYRWRTAWRILEQIEPGRTLISVPESMLPRIYAYMWNLNVERLSGKWESRESEISLEDWKAAMSKKGRHLDG